jgi:uncharacterized iron-regulated membrane protein
MRHSKTWIAVHRWTSLICTAFLLMLCVTGLPLIFHDEIDALSDPPAAAPAAAALAHPLDLDQVTALVRQQYPGRRIQFVVWLEQPQLYRVGLSRPRGAHGDVKPFAIVDAARGVIVREAWSEKDWRHGNFMSLLLALHTDMLMGPAGKLFLGAMGMLFLASLVSGAVLYGPFMRKLRFGTLRKGRAPRLKWLDLHNLLGVAALAWMLVVGATGVMNTLDAQVFGAWQKSVYSRLDLAQRPRHAGSPGASLQVAVDEARRAMPDGVVSFVAYPGSMFGGPAHYAVYMRGSSPLTSRLLHPVLVDATDGSAADAGPPPWYLWALEASRPLHFGDYGGLVFKFLWALLDVFLIVVLASGLYLWWQRRPQRPGRTGTH